MNFCYKHTKYSLKSEMTNYNLKVFCFFFFLFKEGFPILDLLRITDSSGFPHGANSLYHMNIIRQSRHDLAFFLIQMLLTLHRRHFTTKQQAFGLSASVRKS